MKLLGSLFDKVTLTGQKRNKSLSNFICMRCFALEMVIMSYHTYFFGNQQYISHTFKAPSGRPNGNAYLKLVIWCCNNVFNRSFISANFSFSCTVMLPTPSGLPGNVAVLWTTSIVELTLVRAQAGKVGLWSRQFLFQFVVCFLIFISLFILCVLSVGIILQKIFYFTFKIRLFFLFIVGTKRCVKYIYFTCIILMPFWQICYCLQTPQPRKQ